MILVYKNLSNFCSPQKKIVLIPLKIICRQYSDFTQFFNHLFIKVHVLCSKQHF